VVCTSVLEGLIFALGGDTGRGGGGKRGGGGGGVDFFIGDDGLGGDIGLGGGGRGGGGGVDFFIGDDGLWGLGGDTGRGTRLSKSLIKSFTGDLGAVGLGL